MHPDPLVAPTDPVISLAVKDSTPKYKQEVWKRILCPVVNQAVEVFHNSPNNKEKNGYSRAKKNGHSYWKYY